MVGILLISTLVYSFNSAANLATSYDTSIADSALQKFNSNFEKNAIGGEIKIQDIITMVHFANDYNKKNLAVKGDSLYISVKLEGKLLTADNPEKSNEDELIEYLKDEEDKYIFAKDESGKTNEKEFQKYICELTYENRQS